MFASQSGMWTLRDPPIIIHCNWEGLSPNPVASLTSLPHIAASGHPVCQTGWIVQAPPNAPAFSKSCMLAFIIHMEVGGELHCPPAPSRSESCVRMLASNSSTWALWCARKGGPFNHNSFQMGGYAAPNPPASQAVRVLPHESSMLALHGPCGKPQGVGCKSTYSLIQSKNHGHGNNSKRTWSVRFRVSEWSQQVSCCCGVKG